MLYALHSILITIVFITFCTAGIPQAVADSYSGQALHRRPALRQFWRKLAEELEEEIEELEPTWFEKKHLSGGVYHGPIPGRERDTVGFGIAYGKFSDDLDTAQRQKHHFHGAAVDGEDFEILTELTYQFELTPHFIIQPGIYYIIQPQGMSEIANALVLGLQFALNL